MLTGVILTHNEERNIESCIAHLRPHVEELILVDTESTDRTIELARPLVDKILTHPHVANFDSARNIAIPEAKNDWLWFVNAVVVDDGGNDEQFTAIVGEYAATCHRSHTSGVPDALVQPGVDWVLQLQLGEYLADNEIEHLSSWLGGVGKTIRHAVLPDAAIKNAEPLLLRPRLIRSDTLRSFRRFDDAAIAMNQEACATAPFQLRRFSQRNESTSPEIDPSPNLPLETNGHSAHNGRLQQHVSVSSHESGAGFGRLCKSVLIQLATGPHRELLNTVRDHHNHYAERHGLDYWCIYGNPAVDKRASWGKIPLLRSALDLGYERAVWLDADAIITRPEINLAALCNSGLGMVRHAGPPAHWNAGLIIAHGEVEVAELLRRIDESPENDHCWMEQLVINDLAVQPEVAPLFRELDLRFNSVPGYYEVPDPVVVAGHGLPLPIRKRILESCLEMLGARPSITLGHDRSIQPRQQRRYDFTGPYQGVWQLPDWTIDRRHLFWMYNLLLAWPFERAVEVGCLYGASSTAFVEAINSGHEMDVHFCDLTITDSLRSVVSNCRRPEKAHLCQQVSFAELAHHGPFDFVWLDGDHRLPSVERELQVLLEQQPLCVMAHDTSAEASGYVDCEGTAYLKRVLQATSPYLCLEDNARRAGEATHRGMLFATKSPDLFEIARDSLAYWSSQEADRL